MKDSDVSTLATRNMVPEILDELPTDDPRAIGSRKDLVWINALMFQSRIMAGLLRRHVDGQPRRILEIGAGDGVFMLAVARQMARRWPIVEVTLLDRLSVVTLEVRQGFEHLGWRVETITADVFEWLDDHHDASFDLITANLFLHHFQPAALQRLFAGIQVLAPVFVATEPRRSIGALIATRGLGAIGANAVTRHDAPASVRAGFRDDELSRLWGFDQIGLTEERPVGLFTHVFAGRHPRTAAPWPKP